MASFFMISLSEPGKEGCKDEQEPANPKILPFLVQRQHIPTILTSFPFLVQKQIYQIPAELNCNSYSFL